MFSLLDLQFGLWSLDLHILHKQMILGSFIVITHKSTRLENPITWIIWEKKKLSLTGSMVKQARSQSTDTPIVLNWW